MRDERIVYGSQCSWWDSIDKVAVTPTGLPICPHCGGVLFEVDNQQVWDEAVKSYELTENLRSGGAMNYSRFIAWLRGKCFPTVQEARAEFNKLN